MENPYVREANNLQRAFVTSGERATKPDFMSAKGMGFKQLIAEFTDFSFPANKGLKRKIKWAEENFGDRIPAEEYANVPKNNRLVWKKWKKLIKAAIIEDSLIAAEKTESLLKPEVVEPIPEPGMTVNPMPPELVPEPAAVELTPDPAIVEPGPEVIVNPMPPIVDPEPEVIVNPMPLTPERGTIEPSPEPVIVEPEPQVIVNPMPPSIDLELFEEQEVIDNPVPTSIDIEFFEEQQVIGNPMPPSIDLEFFEEPRMIVNPMPPELDDQSFDYILGMSDGTDGKYICGHMDTLGDGDLLSGDDLRSDLAKLSPALGASAVLDVNQSSEELVKQDVQVDV